MIALNSLLTDREAADVLKCSRAALTRFRAERRGPPFIKVGKLIRYEPAALHQWLNSQTIRPMSSHRNNRAAIND